MTPRRLVPRFTVGNNGCVYDESGMAVEAMGSAVVADTDAAELEAHVEKLLALIRNEVESYPAASD